MSDSGLALYNEPSTRAHRGWDTRRRKRGQLAKRPTDVIEMRRTSSGAFVIEDHGYGPHAHRVAENPKPRRKLKPVPQAKKQRTKGRTIYEVMADTAAESKGRKPRKKAVKPTSRRTKATPKARAAQSRGQTERGANPDPSQYAWVRGKFRHFSEMSVEERRRAFPDPYDDPRESRPRRKPRKKSVKATSRRTKAKPKPRAAQSRGQTKPPRRNLSVEQLRAQARSEALRGRLVKSHKSASKSCKTCGHIHTQAQHRGHKFGGALMPVRKRKRGLFR